MSLVSFTHSLTIPDPTTPSPLEGEGWGEGVGRISVA